MASIGVKNSPQVDDPCSEWVPHMETKVTDALKSVASLAGASRSLAAALVRAGALGAAASLAQRFVLAHADQCEGRAALAARYLQEVLRAVGRHLPEVCTPCDTPCSMCHAGRRWVLSGAGAAAGGRAAGYNGQRGVQRAAPSSRMLQLAMHQAAPACACMHDSHLRRLSREACCLHPACALGA